MKYITKQGLSKEDILLLYYNSEWTLDSDTKKCIESGDWTLYMKNYRNENKYLKWLKDNIVDSDIITKQELKTLLLKVKEQIALEPMLLNMDNWSYTGKCGTTHCIGGWLQEISNNRIKVICYSDNDILTLDNMPDVVNQYLAECYDKYSDLFEVSSWDKFCSDDTINYIVNSMGLTDVDSYEDEVNNEMFDDLDSHIKVVIALRVIDDYISEFL